VSGGRCSTPTHRRWPTKRDYENVVNADGETNLLICDDATPVGIIGLNGIDPSWGIAEVGYYVDPEAHVQGYATAAVGLLVDYAFDQRRLDKLNADALATNEASQRVPEKNGFIEESRFRNHGYIDGERVDVLRYGRLAEER
jgi:ribosomal-protein-alanine N-acetyltransferase